MTVKRASHVTLSRGRQTELLGRGRERLRRSGAGHDDHVHGRLVTGPGAWPRRGDSGPLAVPAQDISSRRDATALGIIVEGEVSGAGDAGAGAGGD